MLKHALGYILARAVPGLASFLAIAIYTRMLDPEEYGVYALVVSFVGFISVSFFQWIQVSLLRFYLVGSEGASGVLGVALVAFFVSSIPSLFACVVIWIFIDVSIRAQLVMIAVPLVWVQAWFELNLELARCRFEIFRYGLISAVRSIVALSAGVFFVYCDFDELAPVLGLVVGGVAGALVAGFKVWRRASWGAGSRGELKVFSSYGAPLAVAFILSLVISNSDRIILAWLIDEGAAGLYSASYDFVWQVTTLLFVAINLAAYPLVVKAYEQSEQSVAVRQISQNGSLFLLLAVPVTVGFGLLAPQFAEVFLGAEFRQAASELIPWVAVSAFFSGFRAYHFDLAFQLKRKTYLQVWGLGIAALLNIALNLLLVPLWGIEGAIFSTFLAFVLSLGVSIFLGRRLLKIPLSFADLLKTVFSSCVMAVAIVFLEAEAGSMALLGQILFGALVYALMVFLLDFMGLRSIAVERLRGWR